MSTKNCSTCKESFEASHHCVKYCSEECRKIARNKQHKRYESKQTSKDKRSEQQRKKRGSTLENRFSNLEVLDGEEWVDLIGYEGLYKISSKGRVLSKRGLLTAEIYPRGESRIRLSKEKDIKSVGVHRLIALHFIENPLNLPYVDHIDRNPSNNNIENLRWITHRDNCLNKDRVEFKAKFTPFFCQRYQKEKYTVGYYIDGHIRKNKKFTDPQKAEEFADSMIAEGLFYPY
jgi:hypothetical protein